MKTSLKDILALANSVAFTKGITYTVLNYIEKELGLVERDNFSLRELFALFGKKYSSTLSSIPESNDYIPPQLNLYNLVNLLIVRYRMLPSVNVNTFVFYEFSPMVYNRVIDRIDIPEIEPVLENLTFSTLQDVIYDVFRKIGIDLYNYVSKIEDIIPEDLGTFLNKFVEYGVDQTLSQAISEEVKLESLIKQSFISIILTLSTRSIPSSSVSVNMTTGNTHQLRIPTISVPTTYSISNSFSISYLDYITFKDNDMEYTYSGLFSLFERWIQEFVFSVSSTMSESIKIEASEVARIFDQKASDVLSEVKFYDNFLSISTVFPIDLSASITIVRNSLSTFYIDSYLSVPTSVSDSSYSYSSPGLRTINVDYSSMFRKSYNVSWKRNLSAINFLNYVFNASVNISKKIKDKLNI